MDMPSAEAPAAPIEWRIRSLHDAYQQREPTRYVVDKYLAEGSLTILYGPPAAMKSMMLADLCACVVAGRDWLPGAAKDGAGIMTMQGPAFWIDMDNGTRRTDERIDAVARARDLPDDAPFHYISMPDPPFNIASLEVLIYLKGLIRKLGAKVTVIDNLGLITGEIEENSAAMAMVMGYLRQIAEGTGTALVVIHHQRKGGANGARAGDALRGHSSIEAAVDLALHVVREVGQDEITIRSTKTRGVDVPTVGALFNYRHVIGTNDLERAWFSGKTPRRGDNAIREAIIEVLTFHGEVAKTRLAQEVYSTMGQDAPGVNKIRSWIDDMLAKGDDIQEVAKGKYKLICLT